MTQREFSNAYTDNYSMTRRFLLSRGMNAARADELAQAAWSNWERRTQLREALERCGLGQHDCFEFASR
ncbi:MAG: hypothetical protein R2748_31690 [Bryobacterales bacterium]